MIALIVSAALSATLMATPEERAVLAVVQRFFDTMAAKDVDGAQEVLVPEGRFFSIRTVDGKKVVRSSTNQEFLEGMKNSQEDWLERMWDPEVRIRSDIATVWTPYDFHRNGEFSHCGIDAFDLVKIEGTWKIAGGVYTVEREGCTPSPLGPP